MKDTILEKYEVRKSNREKTAFIDYLKDRLSKAGYDSENDIAVEEHGRSVFRSRNIVVGDPVKADLFLTAHYDTCAVLPFPNLMAPTNPALFLLFQLLLMALIFAAALAAAFLVLWVTDNPYLCSLAMLFTIYAFLFQSLLGYRNKHTANDNTSGTITLTRILEALPKETRDKVCVVYFDNEEKGLLGSSYFKRIHGKDVGNKLLINFDCVGDGNQIAFLAGKKAKQDPAYQTILRTMNECATDYHITFRDEKMRFMMFGSDQMHFSNGIGVCALRKSPIGSYVARIHTPFDTKCRTENIDYLVNGMVNSIANLNEKQ